MLMACRLIPVEGVYHYSKLINFFVLAFSVFTVLKLPLGVFACVCEVQLRLC